MYLNSYRIRREYIWMKIYWIEWNSINISWGRRMIVSLWSFNFKRNIYLFTKSERDVSRPLGRWVCVPAMSSTTMISLETIWKFVFESTTGCFWMHFYMQDNWCLLESIEIGVEWYQNSICERKHIRKSC